MKALRLLHSATVIGAVAIGGAVTGTTLALWQDQEAISAGSLSSGTIGLEVNGSVDADLGELTADEPGKTWQMPVVFKNAGTGKNLRMVVFVESISEHDSSAVPLAVSFRPGDDCTGDSTPLSYTGARVALTSALAPGATQPACMILALTSAELPSTPQTAEVTIRFSGQQVRP